MARGGEDLEDMLLAESLEQDLDYELLVDGSKKYTDKEGYLHRAGGPAIITPSGTEEWWWHGDRIYDVKIYPQSSFFSEITPTEMLSLAQSIHLFTNDKKVVADHFESHGESVVARICDIDFPRFQEAILAGEGKRNYAGIILQKKILALATYKPETLMYYLDWAREQNHEPVLEKVVAGLDPRWTRREIAKALAEKSWLDAWRRLEESESTRSVNALREILRKSYGEKAIQNVRAALDRAPTEYPDSEIYRVMEEVYLIEAVLAGAETKEIRELDSELAGREAEIRELARLGDQVSERPILLLPAVGMLVDMDMRAEEDSVRDPDENERAGAAIISYRDYGSCPSGITTAAIRALLDDPDSVADTLHGKITEDEVRSAMVARLALHRAGEAELLDRAQDIHVSGKNIALLGEIFADAGIKRSEEDALIEELLQQDYTQRRQSIDSIIARYSEKSLEYLWNNLG